MVRPSHLPLLLASGSPRRAQLLGEAGIDIEVVSPDVVERADAHFTARELTTWNAVRKGLAVARQHPGRVILAADTVVALEQEVIGKPADITEAAEILTRLSGRIHQVYSSVLVAHLASSKIKLFCEVTDVRFRKLTGDQIREYLQKIDPLDKAGAYAAQGHGRDIIAGITGSYTNVVGLPMQPTIAALKDFGIKPKPPT